MRIDDGFADGEAEAVVVGAAGAGGFGAVEAVEEMREVFFGDAGAVVGDGEQGVAVLTLRGDCDAIAGVLDGVGEQVSDDLTEALAIALTDDGFELCL